MAGQSYMTARRPAPGAAKRWFDQRVIPAAIDAAGCVEAVVERVATQVRHSPGMSVALAFGAAFVLSQVLPPPRRGRGLP